MSLDAETEAAIAAACARIAPTWPLDRFIAVNPFWGMIDRPLPEVAADLAALSGARLVMPRAWFRDHWRQGRITETHLRQAIAHAGAPTTVAALIAALEIDELAPARRARMTDLVEGPHAPRRAMAWRDFVIHHTSQFCASYFDDGQAELGPDRRGGFYASWRRQAVRDRTPAVLMGLADSRARFAHLPETARALIAHALAELDVPAHERERYLASLLLDLQGWASWCAYRRWEARLAGTGDDHIVELIAIRLAWELVLRWAGGPSLAARWRAAVAMWPAIDEAARGAYRTDWLLQHALERAVQDDLCARLTARPVAFGERPPPVVQAVFCIDVRSEVVRRALEADGPEVATLGFAGFFGMPIEYLPPTATAARPQLPGLLAPRLRVTDLGVGSELARRRADALAADAAWATFKTGALSSFAFVEALGVAFAGTLLGACLGAGDQATGEARSSREHAAVAPRLTATTTGAAIPLGDRCALAAGMLRAMSLTRGFARLVALIGHGSATRNNPHAAGLDCGACGGHTGEVNARAAAALLNEPEVRAGLATAGIAIPATTWFIAGLHNTTTDDITVFADDGLPASHQDDLRVLVRRLAAAGARARRERAARLAVADHGAAALRAALTYRARDWSQVRPEWGLANNVALVIAPRPACCHVDFAGRAFLHDYRSEDDPDGTILELIMTAPMVVAHWINLQYYASTVDHARYGSGNKVLHNVVGGHLGVFEGNGGDLRIGLPLQTLHDGARWVHTPLRLNVFIAAPTSAIDRVLANHATVRALVENAWLTLFQLDAPTGEIRIYRAGSWAERTASAEDSDRLAPAVAGVRDRFEKAARSP